MAYAFKLTCPQPSLSGTVQLESSKSISNRALIIRSLCAAPFDIHRLSSSDDTGALVQMLASEKEILYSGHAGSSYRFMLARACLGDREITLDASEQLRRRPIGPLVRALQSLGADIQYLNKEGFPPLRIKPVAGLGEKVHEVRLQAGISSQYLTALLLIAPILPNGLTLHLTGAPVSVSYIDMTLSMLAYFGIQYSWTENIIRVEPGVYAPRDFTVEGDWSAASYLYSMAALAEKAEIHIEGLGADSIQGDAVVRDIYRGFGVETTFDEAGMLIRKFVVEEKLKTFSYNFFRCPDLAQTVMVTLAGLGIKGHLSGLRTLRIKETDRITAMQTELARVKTTLEVKESAEDIFCLLTGKAKWKDKGKFYTYEDHRMAMAFTPLACLSPIVIREPYVVTKSYPGFWQDVERVGIRIEKIKTG